MGKEIEIGTCSTGEPFVVCVDESAALFATQDGKNTGGGKTSSALLLQLFQAACSAEVAEDRKTLLLAQVATPAAFERRK